MNIPLSPKDTRNPAFLVAIYEEGTWNVSLQRHTTRARCISPLAKIELYLRIWEFVSTHIHTYSDLFSVGSSSYLSKQPLPQAVLPQEEQLKDFGKEEIKDLNLVIHDQEGLHIAGRGAGALRTRASARPERDLSLNSVGIGSRGGARAGDKHRPRRSISLPTLCLLRFSRLEFKREIGLSAAGKSVVDFIGERKH
ncbi:hypothetical protein EVAR_53878_1 [Eumeta japonica]|uniref:Uncharacterized protein n=1 Tax=Eumeta variegata TaxID=151549 RepID=A0A4C1XG76_EUMVA|nr:hypothetical protein EVAR_53878_1 [Eumeta japonica]